MIQTSIHSSDFITKQKRGSMFTKPSETEQVREDNLISENLKNLRKFWEDLQDTEE